MTHISRAVFAILIWAVVAGPSWAQPGIPFRPRIPFHPHIPFPHPVPGYPIQPGTGQDNTRRGSEDTNDTVVGIFILLGIVAVGLAILGFAAWNNPVVASLRILRTPPGEAPEKIRRAWVGVDLPLRRRERESGSYQTVGVLSHQDTQMIAGYAVDGREAVKALGSHSPEAAAWWREHAPHVLASGYRLLFPCDVCEVIDSPGAEARQAGGARSGAGRHA
jgi:hypothetical protein